VIPTNKPNVEQKRYPRPVDLTRYCQPPRGREKPHRINIEWNGDRRAWCYGIFLVYRVDSAILEERLLKNKNAVRDFERTKETIISRLNGSDEDEGIRMDSLKISLLCPLGRTRIKIPCRGVECTHLQCFDLVNYLMMCEKRPVWKCPVCDKAVLYSKLIIDDYFQRMLSNVGSSIEEVELLRDGTWQILKEKACNVSEEDDEDLKIASSSKIVKVQKPASIVQEVAPKTVQPVLCDIITLSDSDEDESIIQLSSRPTNKAPRERSPDGGNAPKRSRLLGQSDSGSASTSTSSHNNEPPPTPHREDISSNSENSVICLDDESNASRRNV